MDATTHILAVEDSAEHAALIRRAFESYCPGIRLTIATCLQEAREALDQSRPDVAILDLLLPDGNGTELLPGQGAEPRLPFIVLTGHGDETVAVAAIKAGAMDYVVKSEASLAELPRTTDRCLREWGHIVQHRQAQAALIEAKKEWQDIFHAIGHPAMILSPDHEIIAANRAAERAAGVPVTELLGLKCWEVFHGADSDTAPVDCPIRAKRPSAELETIDAEMAAFGGTYLVSCTPVHDARGRLTKVIHIATDITQRKRAEEQFRQAQKMEAIGRLAAGVAHDFNNELTVIGGHAELMLSGDGPNDHDREELGEILDAARRSEEITRHLLACGRTQSLCPETVDLNKAVSAALKPLARMIGEDVQIRILPDPAIGPVSVDRSQLSQAIVNLAINARDAMPAGGSLTFTTAEVELGSTTPLALPGRACGHYVMLAVTDSGTGMDSETARQVFEPFFTTKEMGKGTGLGLSIVHGFVEQSAGYIEVDSAPGEGATFRLYLPRADPDQEESPTPDPTPREFPTGSGTVLLVEDEQPVRQIVARVLRQCGYTVLVAGNAREAIPLGEHYDGQIDLLVCDVVLPGMHGGDLATRLRVCRPGLPILFLSGHAAHLTTHIGMTGAADTLRKPAGPFALANAVHGLLRKHARNATFPTPSPPTG